MIDRAPFSVPKVSFEMFSLFEFLAFIKTKVQTEINSSHWIYFKGEEIHTALSHMEQLGFCFC